MVGAGVLCQSLTAGHLPADLLQVEVSAFQLLPDVPVPALQGDARALPDQDVFPEMPVSAKVHALLCAEYLRFGKFQLQLVLQEDPDLFPCYMQLLLAVGVQGKVVTVSDVSLRLQLVQDVIVQETQIIVSEPLAQIVSYRAIFSSRVGEDHIIQQRHESLVLDDPVQLLRQDLLVDARIKLPDVTFQAVFVLPDILGCFQACLQRPSALDTCVCVLDEQVYEYRFQDVHYRVLHDPVRIIRQLVDHSLLRFIDLLFFIFRRMEFTADDQLSDLFKVFFRFPVEPADLSFPPFLLLRKFQCQLEVLLGDQLFPKMFIRFQDTDIPDLSLPTGTGFPPFCVLGLPTDMRSAESKPEVNLQPGVSYLQSYRTAPTVIAINRSTRIIGIAAT